MNIYFKVRENRFIRQKFRIKEFLYELKRPWKIITFSIGLVWLIYGALFWDYSDWDVGVSCIMAGLTYILAPLSVEMLIKFIKYKNNYWILYILLAIIFWIFTVDTAYYLWHTIRHNQMHRFENFIASSYLYFLCGTLWLYKGSIWDFIDELTITKI